MVFPHNLWSNKSVDTFQTAQEDTRITLTANPAQYYWNLTLSGIDVAVNKGKEVVLNLIAQEFEEKTKAIKDNLGDDLYLDGTGNSNKAFSGLVYHIDDTTSITTWQGQSRSTYTTLQSTRNAQSGALAFSDLASDYDACQVGEDSPTLGVTTPAVWTIIEALVSLTYNVEVGRKYPVNTPTGVNEGAGITASAGLNAIYFRGVPIISDEKCTAANFWFLNENHLWFYRLDPDPMFAKGGSKNGFGWTGWKLSQNQDAAAGQLLWYGQMFGDSPRTMSRRTAITT